MFFILHDTLTKQQKMNEIFELENKVSGLGLKNSINTLEKEIIENKPFVKIDDTFVNFVADKRHLLDLKDTRGGPFPECTPMSLLRSIRHTLIENTSDPKHRLLMCLLVEELKLEHSRNPMWLSY